MALQEKLDTIREASRTRVPPDAQAIMRRSIDREGIIRAVDADPDYTRRPEPAQTVEVLRRLPRS